MKNKFLVGVMAIMLALTLIFSTASGQSTVFECDPQSEAVRVTNLERWRVSLDCVQVSVEPTSTPTAEPSSTATTAPTETATVPPTSTATLAPTATGTATATSTSTSTSTPTATVTIAPTATTEPVAGVWRSDFTDTIFNPSSPLSLFDIPELSGWAKIIHARDARGVLTTFPAHHGPNCEPPLTTHDVTQYRDALFACRFHIMTAAGDTNGGYSMAGFAPPVMTFFDAQDSFVMEWRVSTNISGVRDWIDVSLIPADSFTPYSLHRTFAPDMIGSSNGAVIAMLMATTEPPQNQFHWDLCENENCRGASTSASMWAEFDHLTFQERAMTRELFRLEVTNGVATLTSPEHGITWFGPVALSNPNVCADGCATLFMHHTYNATKACLAGTLCDDTTWHWSDISISHAVDMPMVQTLQANVWTRSTTAQMELASPSQGGEDLHCAVLGLSTQISFDGTNFQSFELGDMSQPQLADNYNWAQVVVRDVPANVSTLYFSGRSGWDELSVDSCVLVPDVSP